MTDKAIIIGPSTAGKTTLVQILKEQTTIPIVEVDDILTEMNGGTYPQDDDFKMNVLTPQVVDRVLNEEQIIFFTNADYFKPDELELASSQGFSIIQLVLSRELMDQRNRERVQDQGYEDASQYFDNMLEYQKTIWEQGLVHHQVDSDQPIDKVVDDLKRILDVS